MATGYFSNGFCYSTQNDAIDAFFTKFSPAWYSSSTSEMYHIVSYVNGSNPHSYQMLTYVINNQTSPYTQSSRPTYTLQTPTFASCDLSINSYSYVDAAAMWGFAFSSVFMLWYLAKNLGLIINAVKRW